ncbi:MAG: hypothetical protein K0S07_1378 [Chlamydiales bacterium]|jgi:hypothetical protein|nr:hypothetical protein [Chlamydiales bacterium]
MKFPRVESLAPSIEGPRGLFPSISHIKYPNNVFFFFAEFPSQPLSLPPFTSIAACISAGEEL